MLAPFECLCGDFILPEPASYVFFYAIFNLRKLLCIIHLSETNVVQRREVSQGDIAEGEAKSDIIVEDHFVTPPIFYGLLFSCHLFSCLSIS